MSVWDGWDNVAAELSNFSTITDLTLADYLGLNGEPLGNMDHILRMACSLPSLRKLRIAAFGRDLGYLRSWRVRQVKRSARTGPRI
jgi:hypothetical protein